MSSIKITKRFIAIILAVLISVSLVACSNEQKDIASETETKADGFDTSIYDDYVENIKVDPNSCGYSYTNGGATYIVKQKNSDVSIDFQSSKNPEMNMSMYCIDNKAIYIRGDQYFEDKNHEYEIPVNDKQNVVQWLYDELKQFGDFKYEKTEKKDDSVYDILSSSITEKINSDDLFDYEEYEITFTYKDGKEYKAKFFDCSNKEKNLISGDYPEGISNDTWTVDIDKKIIYDTKSNESYDISSKHINSYKYDRNAPKEYQRKAEVAVNRHTQKVYSLTILDPDLTNEYIMLYPEKIQPFDTKGKSEMNKNDAEYVATMILLMVKSL